MATSEETVACHFPLADATKGPDAGIAASA
jgi:hypothetical protein